MRIGSVLALVLIAAILAFATPARAQVVEAGAILQALGKVQHEIGTDNLKLLAKIYPGCVVGSALLGPACVAARDKRQSKNLCVGIKAMAMFQRDAKASGGVPMTEQFRNNAFERDDAQARRLVTDLFRPNRNKAGPYTFNNGALVKDTNYEVDGVHAWDALMSLPQQGIILAAEWNTGRWGDLPIPPWPCD